MELVLHRLLHLDRVWLCSCKMASAAKPWLTDPISLQKKELRKEMAAKLAHVTPEEAKRQSDLVAEKVFSSEWFKNAQRVSIYTHTAGEIQTDKIVEEALKAGKHVFIPQFRRGDPHMRLLRLPSFRDFTELKPTLWGIPQPDPDVHWEQYEDSGPLDLVIMPGVAFTADGARLGHGMGYYDRMLAKHQTRFGKLPARYALALAQQIVDRVPLGNTDVLLDGVVRAE